MRVVILISSGTAYRQKLGSWMLQKMKKLEKMHKLKVKTVEKAGKKWTVEIIGSEEKVGNTEKLE